MPVTCPWCLEALNEPSLLVHADCAAAWSRLMPEEPDLAA
jgi:hypothetical protein